MNAKPAFVSMPRGSSRAAFCLSVLTVSLALASRASAGVAYDESVSGDLSNDRLVPTAVTVSGGSNWIVGSTGRSPAAGVDRDYFTVDVPTGFVLSDIIEVAGTTAGGNFSFFGMEAGNQLTLDPATTTATGLLGWTHYVSAASDMDIFPTLGTPSMGSTGFSGSLPAGNYSFWIQDSNPGSVPYTFDLELSQAVGTAPDSSPTILLEGLALVAIAGLIVSQKKHLRSLA
jgi:hypothetical protein